MDTSDGVHFTLGRGEVPGKPSVTAPCLSLSLSSSLTGLFHAPVTRATEPAFVLSSMLEKFDVLAPIQIVREQYRKRFPAYYAALGASIRPSLGLQVLPHFPFGCKPGGHGGLGPCSGHYEEGQIPGAGTAPQETNGCMRIHISEIFVWVEGDFKSSHARKPRNMVV